jgi:hypothetical protein
MLSKWERMETNDNEKPRKLSEPQINYDSSRIKIFKSFKEQEEYELQQMANLTPHQILEQLRKLINTAYCMHGYDPANLPLKHDIKIIMPKQE